MKRLIPQRFYRVRNFLDKHGALIAFLIVILAAALGIYQTRHIASQQNKEQQERIAQISALIARDSKLAKENQRNQVTICKLVTGLVLNQPNLDQRLLTVLTQLLDENPQCSTFLPDEGRGD